MKKDILNWNDVKEKYLEFHKMDSFTENMAIDVDFGYWLVNNCIIPDVMRRFPSNSDIYRWIKEKKYQREQGEQEYMMLFELDMPKILKDFTEHLLNGA